MHVAGRAQTGHCFPSPPTAATGADGIGSVEGRSSFLFERLGRVNSLRRWSRNAHFSFGALGAPSRMEAVPASQFAWGPSGGQKAEGAGRGRIGGGAVAAEHVPAGAIRTLRATADLAGFALPVRALTSA